MKDARALGSTSGWEVGVETERITNKATWVEDMATLVSQFISFILVCQYDLRECVEHSALPRKTEVLTVLGVGYSRRVWSYSQSVG